MTCESMEVMLSAYLDDELSMEEIKFVKQHLKTCKNCQEVLYELQNTTNIMRATFATVIAPVDLDERITQSLGVFHHRQQTRRLSVVYIVVVLLAGGAISSIWLTPVGIVMRALMRLTLAVIRGLIFASNSGGHLWIGSLVTFCVLLTVAAFAGLSKLLRSKQSEVVV